MYANEVRLLKNYKMTTISAKRFSLSSLPVPVVGFGSVILFFGLVYTVLNVFGVTTEQIVKSLM
jgi:hypothetical protein